MKISSFIYLLALATNPVFAASHTTPFAKEQGGNNLGKRSSVPVTAATIPVELNQGEDHACLEITVPATVWDDAQISPADEDDHMIRAGLQVTVDVTALGFLRNGCSFEESRDHLNGCQFDGNFSTNLQGHLTEAWLVAVPGWTYTGCFSGPPQAASVVTPITFVIGWSILWYDPTDPNSHY